MKSFTEKSVVEDYIVEKLQEKGWQLVSSEELKRESYEEVLLISNLTNALKKLNSHMGLGGEEIKHVLNELKLKPSGQEGSRQILNFFKNGVPVKFEKDRVVRYVKLFDYEKLMNNEFIISRQVEYQGSKRIRTDIMLYVNGIPLVEIECKSPVSFSQNWYDAYKQIKEYEQYAPELYKYVQIGVAAEQIAKYFPIVPWQEDVKVYEWKEEGKDSIDSIVEMLTPAILMDVIKNFLFFRVEFGSSTKVLPRYMQYRAANKIVERVLNNLEGKETKNSGLIWHWQGSGKTLTMIFAANKLFCDVRLQNPTIFFIIDRVELQEQLNGELLALDITTPELVASIDQLKKVILHDGGRGKRGLFITLIHKFRPEEMKEVREELMRLSESQISILTRKNVIAFVDEAHRSQYASLATGMRGILKNAFFFAFTGTPIAKKHRDTYHAFSPHGERYLDKYFITDSIRDKFTLKIAYQPRLEKKVHLDREKLEAFLTSEFEELPEELRENLEKKIKEQLNSIKLVLENPERIKIISEDVAKHFKENIDRRFKAMVVAGSRLACVRYKKMLDSLLPREYSEVVMTFEADDKGEVAEYKKELEERFRGREVEEIRKEIIEKFKEEEHPKIIIVTDMLLTGFDAPNLQTMYLDKPLKEHRLLQAVARTNRPYGEAKEAGLVVDYVGTLKAFEKAFEIYSKEDIGEVLTNIDELRSQFTKSIKDIMKIFEEVPKTVYDRKTLLRAIEILTSNEKIGKEFLEKYKELRRLFELLGYDEEKLVNIEDYQWLSAIYTYYTISVLRTRPQEETKYFENYFRKTVKYIHKSTEIEKLKRDLPIIEFDENYLNNLEEKVKEREEKAANLVFTINKFVLVDKYKNPVYESISEKAERILRLWKEKNKDIEKIYEEGKEILNEINSLSARQRELNLSNLEYSFLLTLEEKLGRSGELIGDVRKLSADLNKEMFPGWLLQQTARKEVERKIRLFLRRYINRGITYQEMDELYQKLVKNVRNYGTAS
ncbi:MAG: HsdR family type I site-specific deoxyribonuclease [Candidatus Micrarchaeia archaeon]